MMYHYILDNSLFFLRIEIVIPGIFGSIIFGVGDFREEVINTFLCVYKKVRYSLIIKVTKPIKGEIS